MKNLPTPLLMFFSIASISISPARATEIDLNGIHISSSGGKDLALIPEGPRDPSGTTTYSSVDSSTDSTTPPSVPSTQNNTELVLKVTKKKLADVKIAKKMMTQKAIQIMSLYNPANVPYAGALTKSLDCSKKYSFKNSIEESKEYAHLQIQLESNEQFTYGVCEEEKLVYKSDINLYYCINNGTLFEIRSFERKNTTNKYKLKISCN